MAGLPELRDSRADPRRADMMRALRDIDARIEEAEAHYDELTFEQHGPGGLEDDSLDDGNGGGGAASALSELRLLISELSDQREEVLRAVENFDAYEVYGSSDRGAARGGKGGLGSSFGAPFGMSHDARHGASGRQVHWGADLGAAVSRHSDAGVGRAAYGRGDVQLRAPPSLDEEEEEEEAAAMAEQLAAARAMAAAATATAEGMHEAALAAVAIGGQRHPIAQPPPAEPPAAAAAAPRMVELTSAEVARRRQLAVGSAATPEPRGGSHEVAEELARLDAAAAVLPTNCPAGSLRGAATLRETQEIL